VPDEPRNSFRPSGKRDILAVGPQGSVLGLITVHHHGRPGRHRRFGEAAPQQDIGAAGFHHPGGHFAIRPFHVHMNPGVRVDQLHLRNDAYQVHGSLGIELRRKSMMRPSRRRPEDQERRGRSRRKIIFIAVLRQTLSFSGFLVELAIHQFFGELHALEFHQPGVFSTCR
jgi:hypothetical protein